MNNKDTLIKILKEIHFDAYLGSIKILEEDDEQLKTKDEELSKWLRGGVAVKIKNARLNVALLKDLAEQFEFLFALGVSQKNIELVEILEKIVSDYRKANEQYFKSNEGAQDE